VTNTQNNILLISYFMPPSGGISCQRGLRFAKFLNKIGWNCTVLTYEGDYPWRVIDTTLLKDISSIRCIRIPSPVLEKYFANQKNIFAKIPAIYSGILKIDVMSNWVDNVKKHISEILDDVKPDIILMTVPPFSLLELIEILKRETAQIPIIVDMRDLYWILNPHGSILRRSINWYQRSTAKQKIPMWLSLADGFIAPTEAIISQLAKIHSAPATVIHTPFVPEDFSPMQSYRRTEKFRILHSGRIYRSNRADKLLEIFSLLPDYILNRTKLILQGHSNRYAKKLFSGYDWAELTAQVPHSDALACQVSSDVNLVFVTESAKNGGDLIVPGKIFDYIGAGKPIYAIGPAGGELLSFMKKYDLGFTAPLESPELCAGMLSKIFRLWEKNKLAPVDKNIRAKFSADVVIKKLADFLKRFLIM